MTREEAIKVLLQHSEHWKRLLIENICSKEEGLQTVESLEMAIKALEQESLTDTEQRIFLAAMSKEAKVCKEVDEKYPNREPYEDSLVSVCRSIERKVKKVLWE